MTLNQDMQALHQYLEHWRLKLSTAKTTTTAFHLTNNDHPVYPGVTLDRTLTYRQHIESLKRKVNGRNGLLRCLASSSWGACTATLRTGALALVYSAAKYASPMWCRSAHIPKLDSSLNDTMHIITRCMRPTETTFLPVLAGITPPDIRRESHVSNITKTAMENPDHILHQRVSSATMVSRQCIRSRQPFTRHAACLLSAKFDTHTRHGTIVSITVHLPSGPLALHPARHCHPVLTYRESSGWDSTVCALALHVLARHSTAGECKIQQCARVGTPHRPRNMW